ncbi:hypothetical protein CEP13_14500, partial [Cylindrospermopsis raciborskii C03]|uniref:hypothetical protein n=1 Tax=Cylindrospermopsis raciborskii TaxID=77022 RepID=UPI000CBCE67A
GGFSCVSTVPPKTALYWYCWFILVMTITVDYAQDLYTIIVYISILHNQCRKYGIFLVSSAEL